MVLEHGKRVVDDEVQAAVVKFWEGEQDVLTGMMQEIEVLPQVGECFFNIIVNFRYNLSAYQDREDE